jgi:elongation factor G
VRLPLTIDGCDGAVAAALVPAATLPAEVLEAAAGARRALVEAVAELEPEGDVAAMYLEESNVTSAQLRAAVCL